MDNERLEEIKRELKRLADLERQFVEKKTELDAIQCQMNRIDHYVNDLIGGSPIPTERDITEQISDFVQKFPEYENASQVFKRGH